MKKRGTLVEKRTQINRFIILASLFSIAAGMTVIRKEVEVAAAPQALDAPVSAPKLPDSFFQYLNPNGNSYIPEGGVPAISSDFSADEMVWGSNYVVAGGMFPNQRSLNDEDLDIALIRYDNNGNLVWTKTFGTNEDEFFTGISNDADGNTYLTGYTYGDFLAKPTRSKKSAIDFFVIKLNQDGEIAWQKRFGSKGFDVPHDITYSNGRVIVVGATDGPLFDHSKKGKGDAFVLCLDANNGSTAWTKVLGSNKRDEMISVQAGQAGQILVAGNTYGEVSHAHHGDSDIFVMALREFNGKVIWTKQYGSPSFDHATGLAVDRFGNALVTGTTNGQMVQFSEGNGFSDFFVVKFDQKGEVSWVNQHGILEQHDYATHITIDSKNQLYVAGQVALDEKNKDAFVYKYDENGQTVWSRQWGNKDLDQISAIYAGGGKLQGIGFSDTPVASHGGTRMQFSFAIDDESGKIKFQ